MKPFKDAMIMGDYRYWLCREIENCDMKKEILFVMLNPSTADAKIDDPTIRRCMGFARRENCGKMYVVNLYALRSTDPRNLKKHSNPKGSWCDYFIKYHTKTANLIICAWGPKADKNRAFEVYDKICVVKWDNSPIKCLGRTKDGSPRHPLFVRADKELEPFTMR